MAIFLITLLLFASPSNVTPQDRSKKQSPIKVVVAGLSHGHVHWILGREDDGAIEIVGIYEEDRELRQRFAGQYDLEDDLFYSKLETALEATKPEAVTAFGPVYDHLKVVQASAPRGIHVMVEKPLAVSLDHARKMKKLAERHGIHLLTNYETTWYGSNQRIYRVLRNQSEYGPIRKMVARHGHQGPKEIGVSDEFFQWLTNPRLNGGGALMDFGCYGANLMTWLMNGQAPVSVTAVTQQMKPEIYPEVEDEATIILTYPGAQGIIQASWNWPDSRKDLQVYTRNGYLYADGQSAAYRKGNEVTDRQQVGPRSAPYTGPFSYLASVVRGETAVSDTDLSSLELNMTVMQILEAAKRSAESKRTIPLEELRK